MSTRSLTDRPSSSSSTTTSRPSRLQEQIDMGAFAEVKGLGLGLDLKSAVPIDTSSNSPLLTAHRLSTSSMDEVQLEDSNEESSTRSRSTTITSNETSATTPVPPPKLPFRAQGLSGNLPPTPWGPPPPSRVHSNPAPPPKKLSSPFSWLSRNTSSSKDSAPTTSQPAVSHSERRGTVTSITTNGSGSELMLSKLDEGNESDSSATGPRHRNSLRDRFKLLRMREEAGVQSWEMMGNGSSSGEGGALAGLIGRSTGLGFGVGSPTSVADERDKGLAATPAQSPIAPSSSLSSTTDPNLAPGTVSGISAGPSAMVDPAAPVDWDLWQSVVYEGPAAVARTSAEELTQAIASGIPSAIRGVVWQVLAQSKNEELEGVYRELVARGTEKGRKDRDISASRGSSSVNILINGNSKDKTHAGSSASSVRSDHSPPSFNGASSHSPSQERDAESVVKLQAAMMVERKKRTKEDNAALQKLEKTIRRDMGARTSYSKYAAAAGLQEGLFGVCKAYALFDEGVGYAQGMNFLVMPLLFNASPIFSVLMLQI